MSENQTPTSPAELLSQAAEHALKVLPGKGWEHEVLQLQQAAHLAPRVSNYILDYWMLAFARAVLALPAPAAPATQDADPTDAYRKGYEDCHRDHDVDGLRRELEHERAGRKQLRAMLADYRDARPPTSDQTPATPDTEPATVSLCGVPHRISCNLVTEADEQWCTCDGPQRVGEALLDRLNGLSSVQGDTTPGEGDQS